ncbi:hypothetical protein AB0L68_41285 [Streptomyces sp. NPDC052164]|uniref:hypothetical protein n=1 Tax=unclassified Streptomyces TaxID=2593676 RepID=UPI0034366A0E
MLDHIGVFLDDRPSSFELWLESKLDGLATGIVRDVGDWARLLHDGGPRSRARRAATVWNYLNRIRPVLLQWSARYDHLREVTRDYVLTHLETVQGSPRQTTIIALRSLFGRAKKNGTIFKNPTSRIRVGQREEGVIQPLEPEHINGSIAAVTRPADRLILALAAVHAARPAAIRRLQLDDLDIGNQRLSVDGRTRRLDELTLHIAREWLEFGRRRWPDTANPHLLINKHTALGTGPIGKSSVAGPALHRQTATLERLRMDRQLEEALAHAPTLSTSLKSSASARRPRSGTRTPPALSWSRTWNPPRDFTTNRRVQPLQSRHPTLGFRLRTLQFSRTRGGPGVSPR